MAKVFVTTPIAWEDIPAGQRAAIEAAWASYPASPAIAAAPPNPPSLSAMAGSFVGAVVAHVADGGRKASAEVRAQRAATCNACPLHDPQKDACTACGCGVIPALSFVGLDLGLKRSWASSVCPDSPPRWGPV
jgi:hypothetical protein